MMPDRNMMACWDLRGVVVIGGSVGAGSDLRVATREVTIYRRLPMPTHIYSCTHPESQFAIVD